MSELVVFDFLHLISTGEIGETPWKTAHVQCDKDTLYLFFRAWCISKDIESFDVLTQPVFCRAINILSGKKAGTKRESNWVTRPGGKKRQYMMSHNQIRNSLWHIDYKTPTEREKIRREEENLKQKRMQEDKKNIENSAKRAKTIKEPGEKQKRMREDKNIKRPSKKAKTIKEPGKNVRYILWNKCFGSDHPVGKCEICGDDIYIHKAQLMHFNPKSKEGTLNHWNLCFGCSTCNNFGETRTMNLFDQLVENQQLDKIVPLFDRQFKIYLGCNPDDAHTFKNRIEIAYKLFGRYPETAGGISSNVVFEMLLVHDKEWPLPEDERNASLYYHKMVTETQQ